MTGTKPNLFNMHTFGTVCYAYVQNKTKLDPRAEKGIFVGYDRSSPAFLVNYPDQNNVKKIRPVKFAEKFDSVDENVQHFQKRPRVTSFYIYCIVTRKLFS